MKKIQTKREHEAHRNRNASYVKNNIRYIVVHTTCTKPNAFLSAVDSLPYHYLVSAAGKILNIQSPTCVDGTIEIGIIGGMNGTGDIIDTRTPRQNDALFSLLVRLGERYPSAKIVGASQIYVYPFANPGFDLREWLNAYVPDILGYAA